MELYVGGRAVDEHAIHGNRMCGFSRTWGATKPEGNECPLVGDVGIQRESSGRRPRCQGGPCRRGDEEQQEARDEERRVEASRHHS